MNAVSYANKSDMQDMFEWGDARTSSVRNEPPPFLIALSFLGPS
jgi:hypothetical protein